MHILGDAEPLRVMSFNIYWNNPKDPENAWPLRRRYVFQVIEDQKPDVIGLQETGSWQLDDLRKHFTDYEFFAEPTSPGLFDSLLMYRRSRFEVMASDHFWLGPHPGILSRWPLEANEQVWITDRSVSCLELGDVRSGYIFMICNTHFNGAPSHGLKGARLINERVSAHYYDIIVMGDFNALPHRLGNWPIDPPWALDVVNGAYEEFMQAGFTDVFKKVHPFARTTSGCGWATRCKSLGFDARIDWILSKGFDVHNAAQVISRRPNGLPVSDHWPQVADLEFNVR